MNGKKKLRKKEPYKLDKYEIFSSWFPLPSLERLKGQQSQVFLSFSYQVQHQLRCKKGKVLSRVMTLFSFILSHHLKLHQDELTWENTKQIYRPIIWGLQSQVWGERVNEHFQDPGLIPSTQSRLQPPPTPVPMLLRPLLVSKYTVHMWYRHTSKQNTHKT